MANTITFQDIPSGCPSAPGPYRSGGLVFTNSVGNAWCSPFINGFVGTYGSPSQLFVSRDDGGVFDFGSLQVCNPNTAIPPQTTTFTGTRADGTSVSAQFSTPNASTAPQTFAPAGFDDLTSLVVSLGFVAFDNFVFEGVAAKTVTFNQDFPPGCPSIATAYTSQGLTFTNSVGNKWCSGFINGFVGTFGSPSTMTVKPAAGHKFDFRSLQMCNPNPAITAQAIEFTGTRPDGSTISAVFSTPPNNTSPQTFAPAGFGGLASLTIVLGFVAFDNFVFAD
ncbi:hypothetical protein ASD21_01845 [Caulobacter sp. Root1455]|uniref:hypothetical protein n=1 Tax=unclassified Caulobacter TaxID=2648921 RepID=UPI0006F5CB38|nr:MULTISPECIES: hypothetical protein [unclassified Caulobacter]KQY35636.1 hypothetical protein ASD38_03505 [Caulobacter sp. Root487D2Y]KQZ06398.1 hypothetical protein ASD21_01845 [Caulobacter sp. Root1455]